MELSKLQLSEQTASKLQENADRLSVSPEQFSVQKREKKPSQFRGELRRTAEYAFQKNADHYRRLA